MAHQRVRLSLRELQYKYDSGDTAPLQNLIRAFRGIQKLEPNYDLPPEEDHSFFRIAGFHGEPFEGPGKFDSSWWGGYCHHGDVLFPAWHRAYILHLENALRTIPGCEDVTVPFWDETWDSLNDKTGNPIPQILTTPTFELDGDTSNPLYSYKLSMALAVNIPGLGGQRYSKPKGYETVRYPLSGLVGTTEDKEATEVHNAKFEPSERTTILNGNVHAWLDGTVVIDKSQDDPKNPPRYPDTYSVLSRFKSCLNAANYTAFSNINSMGQYKKDHKNDQPPMEDMEALESPHNAIHLAVGGFFQKGIYNADPKLGANGDMGDNETAGFDPIFFLHHCFIDYVFWLWQKKHGLTEPGKLTIDATDPGAKSQDGSVGYAPGAQLTNSSPLIPFRGTDNQWQTLDKITDIENQLGYTYGTGSLDPLVHPDAPKALTLTAPLPGSSVIFKASKPVDRSQYPGSFVIRTFANTPKRGPVEIDREPVLSRWNLQGCKNCMGRLMSTSITPVSKELEQALLEGEDEGATIEYHAHVEQRVFSKDAGRLGPHFDLLKGERVEVVDL